MRVFFGFHSSPTGCDGKVYDAYVAYPRSCGGAVCRGDTCTAVEEFALRILPEVLEGELGYRLFIMGRESLPGEGEPTAVLWGLSNRPTSQLLVYKVL